MRWQRGCLGVWIVLLFAGPVGAQELVLDSFAGLGARAMAMGGAYTALSDDFSGLFWNPAGMASDHAGEFYTSFSQENFRNQTQYFGTPSQMQFSSTRLNAIGMVYPVPVYRGSLVLAGGYGRMQSFDTGIKIQGYDTVSQFEKSGSSQDKGAMGAYCVGGAVAVAPGISVGLSIQVWRGTDGFGQELTMQDTKDAHPDTVQLYSRFAYTEHYQSVGMRAGLLYEHPSGLRVGVVVSSPMTYKVSSDLQDEYRDVLTSGTDVYPTETFSDHYALRYPWAFTAGVAWSRNGWTVSGDAHYVDLQQVSYQTKSQAVSPHVEDFQTQYRNGVRTDIGVEYRFRSNGLALRAGYYRDPLRYVGGGSRPTIQVLSDRSAFTFGLGGRLRKAVEMNLAVVVGGYRQMDGHREDHVRRIRVFASVGLPL